MRRSIFLRFFPHSYIVFFRFSFVVVEIYGGDSASDDSPVLDDDALCSRWRSDILLLPRWLRPMFCVQVDIKINVRAVFRRRTAVSFHGTISCALANHSADRKCRNTALPSNTSRNNVNI